MSETCGPVSAAGMVRVNACVAAVPPLLRIVKLWFACWPCAVLVAAPAVMLSCAGVAVTRTCDVAESDPAAAVIA